MNTEMFIYIKRELKFIKDEGMYVCLDKRVVNTILGIAV